MAKGSTQLAKGLRKRAADFVCLKKKLIIELDGSQHALPDEILKDKQRDVWFEKEGYIVVHFWDNEVLTNTRGVLESIRERLFGTPSPHQQ